MSDLDGAGRRLLDALDALPDPAWCEGIHESPSPIAIGLPDGDRRTLDAADLERWLLAHCEPAPSATPPARVTTGPFAIRAA